MNTQNITLAIPKDVLHRRGNWLSAATSLSALVTQIIVDLVDEDGRYRAACERQLAILDQGRRSTDTQGAATWKREELHER
ncbi:MAG: hypothetical protein U0X20_14555 [Caldilineaceae bacterium]